MSTYDEILGIKPKPKDYTEYGDMTRESQKATPQQSYLTIGSDERVPEESTPIPYEPNDVKQPTSAVQAPKATNQAVSVPKQHVRNAAKANVNLGTPQFDKAITEVLKKEEPTNFETPKEDEQNAKGADGLTAAQLARAYALTPSSLNYDYSPSADTQEAKQKRDKSYAEMLSTLQESMQKYKPLTKEQEEAKKKRDKRNAIISSIGDGLTALANLVATTKGSPNMYDPDNGLSKRYLDYYEKMKADREAKRNAYQNYQQLLYKLNENRYNELSSRDASKAALREKQEADNQKNMADKIKLLIEADKAESTGNLNKANMLRSMALAKKAEEDARWTGAKAKAYIGNQNAAAGAHRASAVRSYAAAAKDYADMGSSGGKSGGGSRIILNNGHGTEEVSFNSKRYKDLMNVVPDMARVAKQLADRYAKYGMKSKTEWKNSKNKEAFDKFNKVYAALSNPTLASKTKLDIVFQNARDFPQLYHHIRQAVGAEAIPQPRVTKPQPKQRVVKPQVKGGNWASGLNFQ